MRYEIEILASDGNLCGEAPIWDAKNGRILWIDSDSGIVYELAVAAGKKSVVSRGLPVAGMALNRGGGMILAGATGLHLWRGQGDYTTVISECEGESLNFNDIIADAKGRVYAGTYYWGAGGMERTGKLYLISPDGSTRVVEEGVKLSNGIGFSPDNRTLYYADSAARRIYAYDADANTGNLARRRNLVKVPSDEGIPDGLTVDADGYIWSAQWYGGQVVRYDPDGAVERRIPMPVKQVSSVAFGGGDLTDLYVTTASQYWPSDLTPPSFDADAAMGGSLYRIHLDIRGKPEHMADFRSAGGAFAT